MVQTKKDAVSGDCLGTGRRKKAIARVRVKAGSGQITINDRPLEQYFTVERDQRCITEVLDAVGHRQDVDIFITCSGGGTHGQAGAARMGISRAMCAYDANTFPTLRGDGFLTRDSRMKERKKYGLRGARRGTQFSKR